MSNEVGKLKASIELDTSSFDGGIKAVIEGNKKIEETLVQLSNRMVRMMEKQTDQLYHFATSIAESTRKQIKAEREAISAAKEKEVATKREMKLKEEYSKWWSNALTKQSKEAEQIDLEYHKQQQKKIQSAKKAASEYEGWWLKALKSQEQEEQKVDYQYHLAMQKRMAMAKKAAEEVLQEEKRLTREREREEQRRAATEAKAIKQSANERAKAMRNAMKEINIGMKDAKDTYNMSGDTKSDRLKYEAELKKYSSALKAVSKDYSDVRAQNKSLDLDMKRLSNTLGKNELAFKSAQGGARNFNSTLREIKGSNFWHTIVGINQAVELARTVIGGLSNALGGLAKSFIQAASKSESLQTRMSAILGSGKEGAQTFEDMAQLAMKSPYTFETILEAATNLLPIMKGGREELNYWMPMLTDLAAVSGLTMQEVGSNFTKAYSAGIAAADLFRERGISAMLGFIPKVEYTAQETRRHLQKGLEEGTLFFTGAAGKLAFTWEGLMGRMSDKWFYFRTKLMDAGPFNYIKGVLAAINDYFDNLASTGQLEEKTKAWGEIIVGWMKQFTKIAIHLWAYVENLSHTLEKIIKFFNGDAPTNRTKGQVAAMVYMEGMSPEELDRAVIDADKIIPKSEVETIEERIKNAEAEIDRFVKSVNEVRDLDNVTFKMPTPNAEYSAKIKNFETEIRRAQKKAEIAGLTGEEKARAEVSFEYSETLKELATNTREVAEAEKYRSAFTSIISHRQAEINAMRERHIALGQKDSMAIRQEQNAIEEKYNKQIAWFEKASGYTKDELEGMLQLNAAYKQYAAARIRQGREEDKQRIQDKRYELEGQIGDIKERMGAVGKSTFDVNLAKAEGDALKLRAALNKTFDGKVPKEVQELADEILRLNKEMSKDELIAAYDEKLKSMLREFRAPLDGPLGQWREATDNLEEFAKKTGMATEQYEKLKKLIDAKFDMGMRDKYSKLYTDKADSISGGAARFGDTRGTLGEYANIGQSGLPEKQRNAQTGYLSAAYSSGLANIASGGDPYEIYKQKMVALQQLNQQYEIEQIKLNAAVAAGTITNEQYNSGIANLKRGFDEMKSAIDSVDHLDMALANFKDTLEAAKEPLADFFMTFAESGKLAFGDFAKSFMQAIRQMAAQKTAVLLLEAAFEGIMGLLMQFKASAALSALNIVDYWRYQAASTQHFAAAGIAASGAAMMGAFTVGSAIGGMFHDGIDSVPREGTWLLDKGERVVDSRTNEDLKKFLNGNGGGTNITVNINNSDEDGVMKALPELQRIILQTINGDIAAGGQTQKTIKTYA